MRQKKESWADLEDDDGNHQEAEAGDERRGNEGGYERSYNDRREGGRGGYERRDDNYRRGGYERRDDGERRGYDNDRRGGYERRGGDDRRGGREDRNRIDVPQKPVPDHPPFIAYVGSLSFGVQEEELKDFFSEYCQVTSVRILVEKETGRSKGFGYVTFADRESLITALKANGEPIQDRKIRVDVADDVNSNDRGDFKDRRGPAQSSRADAVDKWERGVAVVAKDTPPPRSYNRGGDRDRDSDRGHYNRGGDRDRDSERRPYNSGGERKPLDLKPRSSSSNESGSSGAPKVSKPSPFGEAKPRDETVSKQREIEVAEKIKQDQLKQKETTAVEATSPPPKKAYQPPARSGDRSDRGDRGSRGNYNDRKPHNKPGNKSNSKQSNTVPKKFTTAAQTKETKIATSNAFGDLNASVD